MTGTETSVARAKGEAALRAIEVLRAHLAELEAGVNLWPEYRPSVPPAPVIRRFTDAIDAVDDFRTAASNEGEATT